MTKDEVIAWMRQTASLSGVSFETEQAMNGTRYHLLKKVKHYDSWYKTRDVMFATFYEDGSMTLHHPHNFRFSKDDALIDYERTYAEGFNDLKDIDPEVLNNYRAYICAGAADMDKQRVLGHQERKIKQLRAERDNGLK